MAAIVWADQLAKDFIDGVHVPGTDVFKMALSNSPIASSVVNLAGITEIAPGGGYSAGGQVVTVTSSAPATGQGALTVTDSTLTAVGTVSPFRFGLIYNSSKSNRHVGSFDLGGTVNLTAGNNHLFDFQGQSFLIS